MLSRWGNAPIKIAAPKMWRVAIKMWRGAINPRRNALLAFKWVPAVVHKSGLFNGCHDFLRSPPKCSHSDGHAPFRVRELLLSEAKAILLFTRTLALAAPERSGPAREVLRFETCSRRPKPLCCTQQLLLSNSERYVSVRTGTFRWRAQKIVAPIK